MSVPFVNISREIQLDLAAYEAAARRVFLSGTFVLGPEIVTFERAFAEALQVKHAIAVGNGTLALYAALVALKIGPGDEVILPTNSFVATAEAVVMAGARPVFCDVDPVSHHLSLSDVERLCTAATKAIIPVHLYGRMVEMRELQALAARRGLAVIEDTCQAHGAKNELGFAGTVGDLGCFSFYPTKNLGALGEGGAVVTNSDELAERVRAVRGHGASQDKNRHEIFGSNLRLEALQGAFLTIKLARLVEGNRRRQAIADRYREGLSGLPISVPEVLPQDQHVYHLFVITANDRAALQASLESVQVHTAIHYPTPIHLQPAMSSYSRGIGSCPVAEALAGRILSLPMFATMTDAEVDEVIQAARRHYGV